MNRSLARLLPIPVCATGLLICAGHAAGQVAPDPLDDVRQAMAQASGGRVELRASRLTGLASFVKAPSGVPVPGATAEDRALAFLTTYAKAFGLSGAAELRHLRSQVGDRVGMDHVRYRQVHEGIPVTGADLIVHLRGSRVTAVNGRTLGDLAGFSTTPSAPASAATAAANGVLAKHLGVSDALLSEPRLEIFDRGLIGGPPVPTRLTWFVEATRDDLRQFIWVDAETGGVLVHFSQLPNAKSRNVYDANNGSKLPGTLVRKEGQAETGDPDADFAYDFSGDTYDYFFNEHGRDSYDDKGTLLKSTVHFCPSPSSCPYANAFWNGTQMVYGEGFSAADDVDAHELTHAVTETSADLFYYMQSGALNESFSDIFGETVDLTNGAGNDTPGVRWLMGEDVPGFGAIRNMMDPTQFGDPGRMSDSFFFKCSDTVYDDSGGVHSNSGVPNHAYALMVDGGTYNGITVAGIGLTKAGLVQYRSLTGYLNSASDFLENYDALNQSCEDLVGTGGITAADCLEVEKALDAVEMSDPWPCIPPQVPEPALCSPGLGPVNAFKDDLENTKSGNWTTSVQVLGDHWKGAPRVGTPAIHHKGYATSGIHSFWGYDAGVTASSSVQMTKSFLVPAGARMQFNHSWGFENSGNTYWDGGIVEFSFNNGATWNDVLGNLPFIGGAAYNGTITNLDFNPLAGRSAFVGESWGYTATQLDLSLLAGQNIRFRFRIGTDSCCDDYGWFIDDVRIYACDVGGTVEFAAPVYAGGEAGGTASVSVTRSGGLAEGVSVDYFTSDGTATAPDDYAATAGTLSFGSGVTSQSFSVPIVNDTLDDDAETVGLSLTNVTGPGAVLGGQDQATLVIGDDDVAGSLQFKLSKYTVSEGSAFATITVTRSGGIASGVSVDYQSTDGTATSPDDYAAVSGTLMFAAKATSKTFTVPIVADTLDESNETLTLTLSNPGGGGVLGGITQTILTINDNDAGGALQIASASYTLSEGGGSALIKISRSGGSASNVTVNYTTADGTATAGADYTVSADVLSFGAGEMSKTFPVPILDDALGENNETVLLAISSPTGGATLGARKTATLTIVENESVFQFSVGQYGVAETTSKATITVKRSGNTSGAATVEYATADGSALAGQDYTAATGTLSFAAKATSKTFTVSVLNDAVVEGAEVLALSLQSPAGGVLGPLASAALTITDDEPQLAFSTASYSGKEGGPSAVITVKRVGSKTSAATVDYATADGTATAGSDYTATSGTLTLPAGASSKTFSVPIVDDADAEPPETVNLSLSSPTGASLGLASALLTIADDEPLVGFSVSSYSVSEAAASATITVKRTGSTAGSATVDYATSDGSAGNGSDYTGVSGTLSFAPKAVSKTFVVPILADANAEPAETVNLTLSNPSGAGLGISTATLSITDNDASIGFNAAAYTAKESAKSLTVTVKRTGAVNAPASVDFATSDGTASDGSDYTGVSGTLSFGANVSTRTFSVPLLTDTLDEPDETINLALSNPSGGVLGQAVAAITITDDDTAGTIELASATFGGSEAGGSALVTLKRSGGTASGATAHYATSDGTAHEPSDYTATSGTASFGAGQTTTTFSVPILADGLPEATETIGVTLSSPGGGAALGALTGGVIYVVSSDVLPTLSIGDVSLSEGNTGTQNADFSVTLVPASVQTVTVIYTTADGTATAPSDYTATVGTLTFNPTETVKTISVPVVGDTSPESDEIFSVDLFGPVNAEIGDAHGQGTIVNDDPPLLSIDDVSLTEGNSGTGNASFTVSLAPASVQTVTVQYATTDGTATAGTQNAQTFSNAGTITILDNGAATPYPSTITVPSLTGVVTKVTVKLTGFGHSYPADTDVLLVGPAGQAVVLMSDVGGGNPGFSNVNVTLDDGAPGPLPVGAFGTGTYRPTNNEDSEPAGDAFPAPAPGGPYATSLAVFNGVDPAGTWRLYVMDDFIGDTGTINGGWSVTITTNGDYNAVSGTLTFSPSQTAKTVSVPVVGDTIVEGNETYFVNLSNPANAVIADGQGQGTITNDDCSDADGDRLCDVYETDTGVYVSPTDTGTDPADPDTDDDQLPDGDEVLGTLAGLNLPAMGTNPLKKNILLEYDWMDDNVGCGSHSHRPTQAIVDRVSAAFAAAPVANPDATTGIVAIHDFGQGGAFTGGNKIAGATNITGGVNGADFQNKKAVHFAANRNGYFHYVINPHEYTDSPGSSGQAELPGDDLIVSMGCFFSQNNNSNTIMHELGHNLNLHHGGFVDCNWKPNYNSIMNYRFQFPGIDTSCNALGSNGEANTLDYSHGARIALDENNLDENLGVCGAPAIDWNFSGTIQNGVVYDLNRTSENPGPGTGVDNSGCGGTLTTLSDSNDWASVLLTGLADTDGRPLRPFRIIDCNNPMLREQRPR